MAKKTAKNQSSENLADKPPLNSELMHQKLKGDTFPEDFDGFLDENIKKFFIELFEQKGMVRADIIRRANIDQTYGYQLMDGRRIGNRDYYLSIAIAMALDLRTTQRMLAVTCKGALHSLIIRDAAVIFAINHGYDIEKTYDFMCELDVPPLDTGLNNNDDDGDE